MLYSSPALGPSDSISLLGLHPIALPRDSRRMSSIWRLSQSGDRSCKVASRAALIFGCLSTCFWFIRLTRRLFTWRGIAALATSARKRLLGRRRGRLRWTEPRLLSSCILTFELVRAHNRAIIVSISCPSICDLKSGNSMFAGISILAWSRSSASSSITEPTGTSASIEVGFSLT